MRVGVILEGCLRGSGVSAEGVRVSAGPVGCVRAIRGLCLCLNSQGAPATGPSGPGLLPTVPTPSSHHAAAESLISLVGETGAVPEMCGGEGSGPKLREGQDPPLRCNCSANYNLNSKKGAPFRMRPSFNEIPMPTVFGEILPGSEAIAKTTSRRNHTVAVRFPEGKAVGNIVVLRLLGHFQSGKPDIPVAPDRMA